MTDAGARLRVAGVAFDLDGTLIDSRADIVHAVQFALAHHGERVPPEHVVTGFVGDGARLLVSRALGVEKTDPRVEPVLETYLAYYEAHPVARTGMMPFALDALDALARRGVPVAICTNKPRRVTDPVLARLALSDRFRVVVAGGDTALAKPDAEPLHLVAERLGLPASRIAMVGDGVQDVLCGRAAGAWTVAVAGGFASTEALAAAGPDLLLTSLQELVPALQATSM